MAITMKYPITRSTNVRRAAIIAGIGYVLLFVLGVFANFVVREGLIVDGDAAATAANILESYGLWVAGMVAFLAVFILDVVVAWALHVVFREQHRDLSLVTAWFRLIYTVFLGAAIVFFAQATQLLSGADFLNVFSNDQLAAQALVAIDTFNIMWLIGLVAFGLHVALLGYMMIKFRVASRILGWFLIAAGAAYVIDTVAKLTLSNYAEYADVFVAIVAIPAVIAEGWTFIWLLTKAGKDQTSLPAAPSSEDERTPAAATR